MDHLTIPIPDGLSSDQKRELTGFLTDQAKEITGDGQAIDNDPEIHAEIVRRIKRGMEDMQAGRYIDGRQSLARIAKKHGLTVPR